MQQRKGSAHFKESLIINIADGTDELGCDFSIPPLGSTPPPLCDEETEFTCDTGMCVPMSVRCDHVSDCISGEDEKGCGEILICLVVLY